MTAEAHVVRVIACLVIAATFRPTNLHLLSTYPNTTHITSHSIRYDSRVQKDN